MPRRTQAAKLLRRTNRRGQSLVEFALLLPVFLLLFAATLDLGRLYMAQISVTNAAREGAMQASRTPTAFVAGQPCPTASPESDIVMCRTLLEAKGSMVTVQPADVQLSCDPAGCTPGLGNTVTVSVTGHFQLLTPLMSAFFGGNQNVTFVSSSTAQVETLPTPTATSTPSPSPSPSPTATPTPTPSPSPTCTLPSAGFTVSGSTLNSQLKGQAPLAVTFTDTSTSPSACPISGWTWTFGDGQSATGQGPVNHTYQNSGTYQAYLTVTNAAGSATSAVQTITAQGNN